MAGNLTAMIAAAFSGSAAPPVTSDPYFDYTTLLLPGNGTNGAQNNTFLDSSTNNFTITRNGNTTQGTFSPFSQTGWSGSFNTSTTYLTVTDTSNLRFGSSNFTIEAFVYRAASGATQTIASKGASTPTGWVFQISSADKLVFTDTSTSITGATSLAANTWYYVAVVRAGTGSNQTTLYVNAVSDATGTSATTFSQTDNMKIGADRSNTNFANGYISNLRLSNTNRTISSTPTSALAADSNTIFLGLYNNRFQYTDSTAAFTNMTVTGTPSVQAFSPFNPTASWSAATYGGSGYFDGTGDYLEINSITTTDWFTATGNFTYEGWVYPLSFSGPQYSCAIFAFFQGLASDDLMLRATPTTAASTTVNVYGLNPAGAAAFGSAGIAAGSLSLNEWSWVVFTRESGVLNVWINGTRIINDSAYTSTQLRTTGTNVRFGGAKAGTNPFWNGYQSGVKWTSGAALYSGATISVPTAPPTPTVSSGTCRVLLNFTNAGIYDATSKNALETVDGAKISTAQSKFGGSSMAFDGTGDWLLIPDQPIQRIGTGNFTVEGWVYRNSSGTYGLIGKGTGTTGWLLSLNSSNQVVFTYGSSTITSTGTVSATTWTHIAVVREGTSTNQTKIYINGTNDGTGTVSTDFNQTNSMYVGADRTGGSAANAYMQDVRVTNYARYTANFTAPTSPFPLL
jgi:hypothetical protein